MIMMRQWWIGDESGDELVKINDESMISWWWIGNESGDELVKINDESVISRWKSMMRQWFSAELVMSRCLSKIHGFLDTKPRKNFFPTYYLNLTSPVTSTRTSVRLFIMQIWKIIILETEPLDQFSWNLYSKNVKRT